MELEAKTGRACCAQRRCIGDHPFKSDPKLPSESQMVVCDPEVMVITRSDAGKTRCSMVRADGGGGPAVSCKREVMIRCWYQIVTASQIVFFFLVHAPLAAVRTLAVTRELP